MSLKPYNLIKTMTMRELLKLAFAVFLIFGTLGPVSLLARGVIVTGSWTLLVVSTVISGSFSACIIFALRKPWLMAVVIPIFVAALSHSEQIASMMSGHDETIAQTITESVQVTPEEFQTVKERRIVLSVMSAALIGLGWMIFAFVLNAEGKRRGRLESELKIAHDIQQSLLPQSPIHTSWCSVSGFTVPASEVGGDYFDIIKLSDNLLVVVIADVSGHGVGAGIIAAMMKSALYLQLSQNPLPSDVLTNLNTALIQITDKKTFITCALLLFNNETRTVHVATAGHPPVLCRQNIGSQLIEVRTPNLGLGMKNGVTFEEKSFPFSAGDIFFLYTDGIIEAVNKNGEPFGLHHLREIMMTEHRSAELCPQVIHALQHYCGSKEFKDDATVLSISIGQ